MPDLKDLEGPTGKLNRLGAEEARAALLACCGSARWAAEVAALRPFWDVGQLLRIGRRVWFELESDDWLEAFRAHPRIGESSASADTLDELARANREYEERFGFIYIVCATGRTAEEMLALLRGRLSNDPDAELRVAAEEQWRITELRLKKFLNVK